MWAKLAVSLTVGVILLVALIIFVNHNNTDSNQTLSPSEQAKVNKEAERVVAADQAPQMLTLPAGQRPRSGFERTVHDAMASLVNKGVIDGPLQRVRCTRHGGTSSRQAFTCVGTADNVNYNYVGVVDVPGGRLTYCKRDEPPVPSQNIPVSAACRA